MATVNIKSLSALEAAEGATTNDLFHVGQGTADRSSSLAVLMRHVTNVLYPIGVVEFFTTKDNPNALFPGQKWARLANGANRVVRLASESGVDAGQIGGNDKVTLTAANMATHAHGFSLNSGQANQQQANTSPNGQHGHITNLTYAGDHQHQGGAYAPGAQWGEVSSGSNNQSHISANWTGVAGNHNHSVGFAGNGTHTHSIILGAHTHVLQGDTYSRGDGNAFGVYNTYVRLSAWTRTG